MSTDHRELRERAARLLGWRQTGSGSWHPEICWRHGSMLACMCCKGPEAWANSPPTLNELMPAALETLPVGAFLERATSTVWFVMLNDSSDEYDGSTPAEAVCMALVAVKGGSDAE